MNDEQLVAMVKTLGNSGTEFTAIKDDFQGYRLSIAGTSLVVERADVSEFSDGSDYRHSVKDGADEICIVYDGSLVSNELDPTQLAALRGAYNQMLAIDQERSQAVVQEPPVAGYAPDANPHLQEKANVMVAVEAPVQATEIDLRDLMSQKTLGIMETGKVPQQRVEVDGKTQLVDRTPEEGLAMVARAAYGAKNFCEENSLPHTSHLELITTAAESLILNGPEVTAVLDSIEKDKCRPVMEVATRSQAGVWARIEEKYPEYADKVPEAIKVARAALPVVTEAKAVVTQATTRQVPAPKPRQKEAQAQLPTQFEMAVTVAAYNLQKAGVERMGHDNDKAKVIFNKSKDDNISVINKEDNTIIASRNAVTGQVLPGVLPEGQDYTKAYAAVVQKQTEKYTAKTAVATSKAKAKAGDGR